MLLTATEENYIKAVFHLQTAENRVSTNSLAAELQTQPASVTDMLKKLKGKQILFYEPYKGVTLTTLGKTTALTIVRKHRLWEYFLVNTLQFGWEEVHEVAEELEHITSKKLVEKLDRFLGFPRFDPHGDPIPDIHGKMLKQKQINLLDQLPEILVEVNGVGSQTPALLEILKHKNIIIGKIFW